MSTCETTERVGNDIVDADGEVIGIVGWEDFVVETEADARRVMREMRHTETLLRAAREEYEATLADIERLMKQKAGRLRWLKFRFDAQLEAHARRALAGSKKRTLLYPEGCVEFRTQRGGWKWAEKGSDLATPWAKENAPELIRTKQIEDVPFDGIKALIAEKGITVEALYDDASPPHIRDLAAVVEFAPDRETVTIKTGVKA